MFFSKRKLTVALLTLVLLTQTNISAFAAENGWTVASQTQAAQNGKWTEWTQVWESIKNSPTQIILTPGKNATELNFAWYSKDTQAAPKIKIGKSKDLSDARELTAASEAAVSGYKSNKATATDLQENTTYYYSYQENGKWTDATAYKTQSTKSFSFLYVGDPQIGASASTIVPGTAIYQNQEDAVRNDSFNWNSTINTALKTNPNISFIISAGDQVQTVGKQKGVCYEGSEIEYGGFISPEALRSIPIATVVGNHEALHSNHTMHFNEPNASKLGFTPAGADYYYTYGNTLFIMLNTNNTKIEEHKSLIEKAISENPDAKWRIITMHQDIYGSGTHSNAAEVVNLRDKLTPVFENNEIDVVLTGHDHSYSRALILRGGEQDKSKTASSEDKNAVQDVTTKEGSVVDPKGILYMTAGSASGSKYYALAPNQQAYIASRWQEDIPTYSSISITDTNFTIDTYRTDTGEKIDNTFSIVKTVTAPKLSQPAKAEKPAVSTTASNDKTGGGARAVPVVILVVSLAGLVAFNRKRLYKMK